MVTAVLKRARVSAQKCKLVVDLIRGTKVSKAMEILEFLPKKSAFFVKKLLESAIANADHNHGLDVDELVINQIYVEQGPSFKRFFARAKGRGNHIEKQTCHITIIIG